jgi:hypothetical protein
MNTNIVRMAGIRRAGVTIAAGALLLGGLAACGSDDPATATFTTPADGARVAGGVQLVMAADGIDIEPAGSVRKGAGHFHVIVDHDCVATGAAIARDADHVHLGGGQSEGVIYLEPGRHDLCLQIGNGGHSALGVTDRITVEVGIASRDQWCSVVGDVDRLFEATDTSDDEFAVQQIAYENIRRLISQLSATIDLVDDDVREDVHASLAFAADLATAVATASDEHAAEQAVETIFENVPDDAESLPGSDWIRDTCGVDVDG